jgi:hypothetical protein
VLIDHSAVSAGPQLATEPDLLVRGYADDDAKEGLAVNVADPWSPEARGHTSALAVKKIKDVFGVVS